MYVEELLGGSWASGGALAETIESGLRDQYGLNDPSIVRYGRWMYRMLLEGDMGVSLEFQKPVTDVIGERLLLTVILAVVTALFAWGLAVPIGIYSAVRQHSPEDYIFTFVGFLGLAVPDFLLALWLLWISFAYFDQSVGGLFSPEYLNAPWTWGRVVDLVAHLWIAALVVGTAGTAALIRVMRANLLDELSRPYVETARAKGLPEWKVLLKYPVRLALNPFVSSAGLELPRLISGSLIVATVMSLPTLGPLLLRALLSQDMYMAGSIVMILTVLTLLGVLISDIILALMDPRIRMGG